MCIRDRPKVHHAQRERTGGPGAIARRPDPRNREPRGGGEQARNRHARSRAGPVSYTHLDVYKRQEYGYLDGQSRNRADLIRAWREGTATVVLISLKAGGFGLTLTEADYVFVLDPWWNPAAEAQAVDRTHRIGQDKTVMVYRLIAQGTIEEKVLCLLYTSRCV